MIMDEMAYYVKPLSKEERRGQSYYRLECMQWNIVQRFNDRFDVMVGGGATPSMNAFVIDWADERERVLTESEAEREGFYEVVAFLRKRILEYETWKVFIK